jgi:hypothetical protein
MDELDEEIERQIKALSGPVPDDPEVKRIIEDAKAVLRRNLRQMWGEAKKQDC